MDWIIHKSRKITCHTVLGQILKPLGNCIDSYNWILADIEGGDNIEGLPINYEEDYFILSPGEFREILESHFQFYWGSILAIPESVAIKLHEDNLPYVEGNPHIFENGHIQYPDAEIEIDCFDSGYTIVKFTNQTLSDRFKTYFEEALTINEFNSKYIK